jgi:hypothetical protein
VSIAKDGIPDVNVRSIFNSTACFKVLGSQLSPLVPFWFLIIVYNNRIVFAVSEIDKAPHIVGEPTVVLTIFEVMGCIFKIWRLDS